MDILTEETEPGDAAVGGPSARVGMLPASFWYGFISTWSVGAKACHDPESMLAPCEHSIKNPTTESTYTTGERTVILGGSVSGTSIVTWANETNGLSGEGYVTYADWGSAAGSPIRSV